MAMVGVDSHAILSSMMPADSSRWLTMPISELNSQRQFSAMTTVGTM